MTQPYAYAVISHTGDIGYTVTVKTKNVDPDTYDLSADHAQDLCRQHINDAIANDEPGAGQWTVRPLSLGTPEQAEVPKEMMGLVAICQSLRDCVDAKGLELHCSSSAVNHFLEALAAAESVTEKACIAAENPEQIQVPKGYKLVKVPEVYSYQTEDGRTWWSHTGTAGVAGFSSKERAQADAEHGDYDPAESQPPLGIPKNWSLKKHEGDDECPATIHIYRGDGVWCGGGIKGDSGANGLRYEFLDALLSSAEGGN